MVTVVQHYWSTHSDATRGAKQATRAGKLLLEWLSANDRSSAKADDFSTAWQHDFIRWCATVKKHAVGTISRNMSILAAAMNHAVKRVVVEQDGVRREVQLMKYAVPVLYAQDEISKLTDKPKSRPRGWLPTFAELAAFIDGIGRRTKKGEWDQNRENLFRYVVVALNTWARPEAILELHVPSQVNFESGFIDLNPVGRRQTKKVRPIVPLTDNLRGWLEHWKLDRPVHRKEAALTTVKKVFGARADDVDMPLLTPYTLRHFMATNVRRVPEVFVPREQRQEWLGHKPQDTTSWYEHHDVEWMDEARRATDAVIRRLNGELKVRSLLPPDQNSSQATPKMAPAGAKGLRLVSSK